MVCIWAKPCRAVRCAVWRCEILVCTAPHRILTNILKKINFTYIPFFIVTQYGRLVYFFCISLNLIDNLWCCLELIKDLLWTKDLVFFFKFKFCYDIFFNTNRGKPPNPHRKKWFGLVGLVQRNHTARCVLATTPHLWRGVLKSVQTAQTTPCTPLGLCIAGEWIRWTAWTIRGWSCFQSF